MEEDPDSDEEEGAPVPSCKKKRYSEWQKSRYFSKTISIDDDTSKLTDRIVNRYGASPFQVLKFLNTYKMVNHIVCQANLYGNRDKSSPNFCVTRKEICKILGMLLLSGYHFQPEEQNYWSRREDLGVTAVSQAVSSNIYHEKKKHLHFADKQNLTKGDKMSKISPLYDVLNRNLVQFSFFHKLLSVDEFMVPYFGRHRAEIFIRGKPISFGFKIWSLCGNDD